MDFLSKVDQVLSALAEKGVSYRLISESFLTEEWDGIDDLLVLHHCGSLGKRKLQGFCAAGGRVVRFNEPIGVAEEQPFEEWIISNVIQKSDLGFGAAEIPIFELRSL
jgi:hypothetical protein